MGFKAEVSSVEIGKGTFHVGDTIYITSNIGRWEPESRSSYDFYQRGLRRTIDKIVVENSENDDTEIFAVCYGRCMDEHFNLQSGSVWHKEECALEYCNLAYDIYSKGEEYRKEHWSEFCDKISELRKKDCS